MLKNIILILVYLALTVGLLTFAAGCLPKFKSHESQTAVQIDTIPATPQQVIIKTIEKNNWLVTLSILGIGLSVFALVSGNTKFGFAGAISSGVILVVSLAIARYFSQIALIGVIAGVVIAAGTTFYMIAVKNKALQEIVANIQNFKRSGNNTEILKSYLYEQSPATQELVKKIREKTNA